MLNRNGEKTSDLGGIEIYEKYYGINMPLRAKYIRQPNRIYFAGDPKHGEILSFFCSCDNPSSNARGLAHYWCESGSCLVDVNELEPID